MFTTSRTQHIVFLTCFISIIFYMDTVCSQHVMIAVPTHIFDAHYIPKNCTLESISHNPVIRPQNFILPDIWESTQFPNTTILRKEKFHERFGGGFTAALTEELGITGQAPEKLPVSSFRDLLGECHFIEKYYTPIAKPHEGCLVVYTDKKDTVLQCAIITHVPQHSSLEHNDILQCRAKSKSGLEEYIVEHDLFCIPTVYGNYAYFFELKPEFKADKNKMLSSLQADIAQSSLIKQQLLIIHNALFTLAKGQDIKTGSTYFDSQPTAIKKINYLFKTAMGLNINSVDETGKTPFIYAVQRGDIKMMTLFVLLKAHINHQDNLGNTALHYAAQNNDTNTVYRLLEEHKADGTIKNNKGELALTEDLTKIIKYTKEVLFSLAYNQKMNFEGQLSFLNNVSPLQQAQVVIQQEMVDINYQDSDGFTALMVATDAGNIPMVKLLLENGADRSLKDSEGRTAFDMAFINYQNNKADTQAHVIYGMLALLTSVDRTQKALATILHLLKTGDKNIKHDQETILTWTVIAQALIGKEGVPTEEDIQTVINQLTTIAEKEQKKENSQTSYEKIMTFVQNNKTLTTGSLLAIATLAYCGYQYLTKK